VPPPSVRADLEFCERDLGGSSTSTSATRYRQVSGGSGFGCLPYEQHFGLAGDASVDSLEIRWPAGTIQHFSALPANARITITEGNDFPERR
jgi:hypothetical protein